MREIRKRRYVLAGILTAMVFVLGLLLGLVIEGKRVELVQDASEEAKVAISSLQLQYAFIDQLSQVGNCADFMNAFGKNVENLETARIKLSNYQDQATVNRREFELLYRNYITSQVQYLLLSMKAKKLCSSDIVNVQYFFSEDCKSCDDQSFVLTFLKQKFGQRLFIFGFDASFRKEPLLNLMVSTYNVTGFPTLVIENTKYVGFMPNSNLTGTVCALYGDAPDYCRESK